MIAKIVPVRAGYVLELDDGCVCASFLITPRTANRLFKYIDYGTRPCSVHVLKYSVDTINGKRFLFLLTCDFSSAPTEASDVLPLLTLAEQH